MLFYLSPLPWNGPSLFTCFIFTPGTGPLHGGRHFEFSWQLKSTTASLSCLEGEGEVRGIQLQHATSPLDVTKYTVNLFTDISANTKSYILNMAQSHNLSIWLCSNSMSLPLCGTSVDSANHIMMQVFSLSRLMLFLGISKLGFKLFLSREWKTLFSNLR